MSNIKTAARLWLTGGGDPQIVAHPDLRVARLGTKPASGARRAIYETAVLLSNALSILRWPLNVIRILHEYDRLHFRPMRRVRRGVACIVDTQTWFVNGQNVKLGDFVKISAFSSVMAGQRATISIGSYTIIGPNTLIVAFNHGTSRDDIPIRYQHWEDTEASSITIGSDVWIGGHAIILPGAEIGTGAVIAAGALVKGSVKPHTIYSNKREARSNARRHEGGCNSV